MKEMTEEMEEMEEMTEEMEEMEEEMEEMEEMVFFIKPTCFHLELLGGPAFGLF